MTETGLQNFLTERNEALRTLDEEYVARTLPRVAPGTRLLILHKSRYECTAIDRELRHESRKWLAEHGYKRMTGTELLPEGELPE